MSLLQDLLNLFAALKSGDIQAIWSALRAICDVVFGPQAMQSSGEQVYGCSKDELKKCVEDITSRCNYELGKIAPRGDASEIAAFGKIGDGTIFKLILQLLPVILALFDKPAPSPVAASK